MVVWKPTAAEATFLYGKLEGYQSSYGSITDVAISIRILGEFKSHFSGTQRVPPIEYILTMIEEYKAAHPHFTSHNDHSASNLGPAHISQFVNTPAPQTGIDYNFYQDYSSGLRHQSVDPASLANNPLGINLHPGNYSGYLGMDMQFSNAAAQGELQQFSNVVAQGEVRQFSNAVVHDEVLQFSNTVVHDDAQQLSDGAVDDDTQDDDPTTDLDSASVDGGRSAPIAVELNGKITTTSGVKSGNKRKNERNMFYGRKTTGLVLYAQQHKEITRCVEARIKDNPELRGARVNVLAEERGKAWEKLPKEEQEKWSAEAARRNNQCPDLGSVSKQLKTLLSKLSPLQVHAYEAFSFPMASFVFTPPTGMEPAKAHVIYAGTQDHPSFTDWLETNYGPNILATFMERLDEFAKSAHKGTTNTIHVPDDTEAKSGSAGSSTAKVNIKDKGLLGAFWGEGKLSTVPNPSRLKANDLRHIFRVALFERWKACGYEDRQIPWSRIKGKPANFIQPELIDEGVEVLVPEEYNIDTLRSMVQILFDHQTSEIPYEKGLIFLPCGTGTELYYPTKRGKGKARAGTAKAVSPPLDASDHIDIAAAPAAAITAAFPGVSSGKGAASTIDVITTNSTPPASSDVTTSVVTNPLPNSPNVATGSIANATVFAAPTVTSTLAMASYPPVPVVDHNPNISDTITPTPVPLHVPSNPVSLNPNIAIHPTTPTNGATELSPADTNESHTKPPTVGATSIVTAKPAGAPRAEQQPEAAGGMRAYAAQPEPSPPSNEHPTPADAIAVTSPAVIGNGASDPANSDGLIPSKERRSRHKKKAPVPVDSSTPRDQPARARLPRTATLKRNAEQAALGDPATLGPSRTNKAPRNT